MNDKKFIEELKFKREEYGVSQKRLAVACGISREHYNRIETGKLPLTEELKAEIQKQLERLNPLEPMFILVDYFRVRFPTTDPLTVIKDILHIKPRHMLHEEYGRYGYEEQYILGDITVLVSSNPSLGVLLELKGKGCRQIEGYLLAQQRSWFDLMMDCLTSDGVIKRLDLAINDRVGVLDIPKLIEKYQRGECISYFRRQKRYDGTDKNGDDIPESTGNTMYIGSTQSELYFCIYEKAKEQYVKKGIAIEDSEIKNRFEIRMKNERAYKTLLIRMIKKYNKTHDVPLPHITPHTLRHTFCTRLAQKNMNPKNLQYIMGHSNISITLNLYAHASEVGANKEMRSMIA